MKTEEILQAIKTLHDNVFPQTDRSRAITLTGSVLTLPNESCKTLSFINTTGGNITLTIKGGGNIVFPVNAGATLNVLNTNLVTVNGTNGQSFGYIISE